MPRKQDGRPVGYITLLTLISRPNRGVKNFRRHAYLRRRRRTISDFATLRFGTLPVSLTFINGPVRIAIGSGPQICLQKFLTPRFRRDISVRSVIYPTGRPSSFRGKPNNNVLPTLLIRRIRTICDIATFRFGTFPVSLTLIKGSVRIAIGSGPQISLQKFLTPRFGRDISVRSVTYPMGRPSCFRGKPNINVLPTLIIKRFKEKQGN